MTKLRFLIIRYFLKRLNGNYVQFKRQIGTKQPLSDNQINTRGGKETCSNAGTVPSTVQYLPICCPLGHLIGCPSRNISKRDRKPAQEQKTHRKEVGTIGFQVWDNKITGRGFLPSAPERSTRRRRETQRRRRS